MILRNWCKIEYSETGKQKKGIKQSYPIIEYKCDDCEKIWEESSKHEPKYAKWGGHYCSRCLNIRHVDVLKKSGTLALSKLTKEERIVNASMGGTATQLSPNRDIISFTSDRWSKMTDEEKLNQVTNAANALHKKLEDNDARISHYEKIFKHSKIGYISKGQREVYEILLSNNLIGFVLDGILENMKIDVINYDKKIAIEYNGDYYHCNPRTWKPDDYNKSIKMTASEKWANDRKRRFGLLNRGYRVIVIWENEWRKNKEKYINRIKKEYNETT